MGNMKPALLLTFLITLGMLLAGCGMEGTSLLSWQDKDGGVTFDVKQRTYGGKVLCDLHATRNGKLNRATIATVPAIHELSLLRYDDWLLVLRGPYVIGGYDYRSDKIVPANSGDLPFTYHTSTGSVVASKTLDEGKDEPTEEFVNRPDR